MAKLYEFVIKNKSGETLAVLDSIKNRQFSLYLNKSGDASFELQPTDLKATGDLFQVGSKELYIYRAGKLIWGGELVSRRVDLSDGRETMVVNAKGFFDLLSKKVIGSPLASLSYSSQDAGDIAWDLIDRSQTGTNASFGITRGSHPTTKNRDRTYDDFITVKDAILGLASTNIKDGFDFEIDANKQFNIFYPKGMQKSDIIFEWGRNITSFSEVQDASNMANQIIGIGAGVGSDLLTSTRNADATVQSNYKIRQKTISRKEVSVSATLQDHTDNELALNQVQQVILSLKYKGNLEPSLGSYLVGDSVKVRIKHGIVQVDQFYRVYGIKVKINDEEDEEIDLTFSN